MLFLHALRRIQHRFGEDGVALLGCVYENVGDGADELAVLDDGATRHVCVNIGPTR